MRHEYHQIDWNALGETNGAAVLVHTLKDEQRNVVDAGQGAELALDQTDPILSEFLLKGVEPTVLKDDLGLGFFPTKEVHAAGVAFDGEYPTDAGGNLEQRESVAKLYRDILRFDGVTADQAFLVQQLGRSILEVSFRSAVLNHEAKKPFSLGEAGRDIYKAILRYTKKDNAVTKPIILLPEPSWGVLWSLAEHAGLKPVGYNTDTTSFPDAVAKTIEEHGARNIASILVNAPRNPFSDEVTTDEMAQMVSHLDHINADPSVNIMTILDNPYGFFAESGKDEKGRFLKTGQEGVFAAGSKTPWISVNSFSKVLAAANIGITPVAISDPKLAAKFTKALNITGRITRDSHLLSNASSLFDGNAAHNEMLWSRLDRLREKYTSNRQALETSFAEYMVPGAPNMMAVIKIPTKEIFGRAVECCDGETRILENGNHIIEHLANNHGVVAVNGGLSGKGENQEFLLRLALREETDVFAPAVEQLAKGLQAVNPALEINVPSRG